MTVGAPSPLQVACGLLLGERAEAYGASLLNELRARRDLLFTGLDTLELRPLLPAGGCYILCHLGNGRDRTDFDIVRDLVRDCGVAVLPGAAMYETNPRNLGQLRVTFLKRRSILEEAIRRLQLGGARGFLRARKLVP